MSRPVCYDIIDQVFGEVGKIKEASHKLRHIPQEHQRGLAFCFQEAQFDTAGGTMWSSDEGAWDDYIEYWQDFRDSGLFEESKRWIWEWCEEMADLEHFGWHRDAEAGDHIKILNNW
jgi:hypothetical protein